MNGRIQYSNSSLVEVIFQVRFPSILRIGTEDPVNFQERIRQEYPLFSVSENESFAMINDRKTSIGVAKLYQFVSPDGKYRVVLSNNFISYSTVSYDRWELFKTRCETVVNHFIEIYHPSVIQRIGLRYKNLITPSKWHFTGKSWSELINKELLGVLASDRGDRIKRYILEYDNEEGDGVLSHRHFELVKTALSSNETSLLLDCDYYVNNMVQPEVIMKTSEVIHDCSSRFIRNAFTEKLHEAMDPIII